MSHYDHRNRTGHHKCKYDDHQDADQFGLSQLYQRRGRVVGRSNRMAYAFYFYRRDKLLKEVAEKRLAAIREFTDLGSGIKIAMRDLEIRGAGNLLGEAQERSYGGSRI